MLGKPAQRTSRKDVHRRGAQSPALLLKQKEEGLNDLHCSFQAYLPPSHHLFQARHSKAGQGFGGGATGMDHWTTHWGNLLDTIQLSSHSSRPAETANYEPGFAQFWIVGTDQRKKKSPDFLTFLQIFHIIQPLSHQKSHGDLLHRTVRGYKSG